MNTFSLETDEMVLYEKLLEKELKPVVCAVDEEGYYPESVLRSLGEAGAFQVSGLSPNEVFMKKMKFIELSSRYCTSTSFLIWCHFTAISFLQNSNSDYLKKELLPLLEAGRVLAGTGLSNPMKYYAGMEPLRLKAKRENNGYTISGTAPFVSNIGPGHWFGIIAQVNEEERIMAMVDCDSPNLMMTEIKDFAGLNGTGTYTCRFDDLFIPDKMIISEKADEFIPLIRSEFVLTQSSMGFGLIKASMDSMSNAMKKQNETNKYIGISPEDLELELAELREQAFSYFASPGEKPFTSAVQIRLRAAELTLTAVETAFLYHGAAGYHRKSDCMRRLREALFVAVVTPAVKHLKRILQEKSCVS